MTFETVDPNVVAKAQTQLATTKSDLPLMVNDYVGAFINFFANSQKGHNTLLHSFQRYGRYKADDRAGHGRRRRAPRPDLPGRGRIQLSASGRECAARAPAACGSSCPTAITGSSAICYVDERFDPEKSTRAYARYMKYLYSQLGDWYLAMAAYDWGAGNVQQRGAEDRLRRFLGALQAP